MSDIHTDRNGLKWQKRKALCSDRLMPGTGLWRPRDFPWTRKSERNDRTVEFSYFLEQAGWRAIPASAWCGSETACCGTARPCRTGCATRCAEWLGSSWTAGSRCRRTWRRAEPRPPPTLQWGENLRIEYPQKCCLSSPNAKELRNCFCNRTQAHRCKQGSARSAGPVPPPCAVSRRAGTPSLGLCRTPSALTPLLSPGAMSVQAVQLLVFRVWSKNTTIFGSLAVPQHKVENKCCEKKTFPRPGLVYLGGSKKSHWTCLV